MGRKMAGPVILHLLHCILHCILHTASPTAAPTALHTTNASPTALHTALLQDLKCFTAPLLHLNTHLCTQPPLPPPQFLPTYTSFPTCTSVNTKMHMPPPQSGPTGTRTTLDPHLTCTSPVPHLIRLECELHFFIPASTALYALSHLPTCSPAHLSTCPPAHLLTRPPALLTNFPPVHLSPGHLSPPSPSDLLSSPATQFTAVV